MQMKTACLALFGLALLLPACGIGYNRALFVTKSNVGLDFDATPPTAEISIARREGAIAPTFENGKTVPLMSSFSSDSNAFSRFFLGASSTFTGGDAAIAMAALYNDPDPQKLASISGDKGVENAIAPYDSAEELDTKPVDSWFLPDKLLEPGSIRPLFFGTDSTLGLKVGYSGQAGSPYPTSLQAGYMRKELALAPVSIEKLGAKYMVKMPSFLAVANAAANAKAADADVQLNFTQYFATGKAATLLAMRQDIRKAMYERMDPTFQNTQNELAAEVQTLLDVAVGKAKRSTDAAKLKEAYKVSQDEGLIPAISGFDGLGLSAQQTQLSNALEAQRGTFGTGEQEQLQKLINALE